MGVTDIKDEKFITQNKGYLNLMTGQIDVDKYLKYEKLGLRIKFVMQNEKIYGFWLTYYEI